MKKLIIKCLKGSIIKLIKKLATNRINAANIIPEQWTAAQDAAIARGDMAEAQRLRNLHLMTKANKNSLIEENKPLDLYHNTDNIFTSFDLERSGLHDPGYFGRGIYVSPGSPQSRYGANEMHLYANVENPLILDNYTSAIARDAENFYNRGYHSLLEKEEQELQHIKNSKAALDLKLKNEPNNTAALKMRQNRINNQKRKLKHLLEEYPTDNFLKSLERLVTTNEDISVQLRRWEIKQTIKEKGWQEASRQVDLDNYDAVIPFRPDIYKKSSSPKDAIEIVIKDGRQIKSANAVTYDPVTGKRIPLGDRDNFNINDIRYGLLPFISLGALGTIYGTSKR